MTGPVRTVRDENPRASHVENLYKTIRTAIRWAGIVVLGYFGKEAVVALAGKVTFADLFFVVKWTAAEKTAFGLSWANAIGWAIYGVRQRYLRKNYIQRTEKRIRELESGLDPKRSSSNLTPRGDTNPEDQV